MSAFYRQCWCGHENIRAFSPLYARCEACGTLVLNDLPQKDLTHVTDDENDLYGKNYYLKRLVDQYGYPPLEDRARYDLPERCLYWLRTLLKYKLPPAKVLELGSSHGGFVAMLNWAGYDATGLELSPWLVDFAVSTFGVPMLTGPVEDQDISAGSLDAIVLMDVLEHLPDPLHTLQRCLSLLKPDGIVLIQTPNCPEDSNYEQLLSEQSPFLEQMKEEEHFFLFSQRAMRIFFNRLGVQNISFEPAIFSHYDMFFAAGRSSFTLETSASIVDALSSIAGGRLIQAMIDLDDSRKALSGVLHECEADRAARLQVIQQQEQEFSQRLSAGEADRAACLEVIRQHDETINQQGETINLQKETISQHEETIRQMGIVQDKLMKTLADMKNSASWKVTAPFRRIFRQAKAGFGMAGNHEK